jgi:type I restriction enzyme S subunit
MSAVDELAGTIPLLAERPYGEVKKGYTCFQEGDVLFAKITPCMQNGKSAIARGLVDRLGFGSTEFHVLRPSAGVTSEWIHLWLRQQHILEDAARHFTGAVGQQRVPADYLALLNIPLPPLSEQHRIAEYLDGSMKQVDSMVASLDSQAATLDSLRTSLLDAAFSGQV